MAALNLKAWGRDHQVTFKVSHYAYGNNLYIGIISWDEGFPEPWSNLTVNLGTECDPDCGFIDVNNNHAGIIEWLVDNNLGKLTGRYEPSGFVMYPEFKFDMEEIGKYEVME